MRDVITGSRHSPTAFLRALIAREGGSISVERFMQAALYHPVHGYYTRTVHRIGRVGDFSTTATLHGALGQSVAAWAKRHRPEVQSSRRWHLIELGGGSGQMAKEVLRTLGWWEWRGLSYHLVDISAGLRAAQSERLAGLARVVQWHDGIRSALAAAEGSALVFSNEFVDAFPCVQLFREAGARQWREVHVAWPETAGQPREVLVDWAGPAPILSESMAAKSQRVEIHRSYRRWLEGWLPHWRRGRMLTIDYGGCSPALYHRRTHGTLRAYCGHMRFDGLEVYERFGQQDLTADVNFGDLQTWSDELGLDPGMVCTQSDFLKRWTPQKRLNMLANDPVFQRLADLDGAGGAFKVLEQVR